MHDDFRRPDVTKFALLNRVHTPFRAGSRCRRVHLKRIGGAVAQVFAVKG